MTETETTNPHKRHIFGECYSNYRLRAKRAPEHRVNLFRKFAGKICTLQYDVATDCVRRSEYVQKPTGNVYRDEEREFFQWLSQGVSVYDADTEAGRLEEF